MPDPVRIPPQAARTIEGLRDTGYEPADALEDIIDNSIAADATRVVVRIWMEPDGSPVVTIADNGIGMDGDGLLNAMTYGAAARESRASLGKFGLGLKTASTAMCRQLTVVSRPSPGGEPQAAMWDLDIVREKDDWWLQRPDPTAEQIDMLDEVAEGGSGTLVIWRKVDRLINEYKEPTGKRARAALDRRRREFRDHLALTYLRFLRGDAPYKTVEIIFDDEPIEHWDPFGAEIGAELLLDRDVPVKIRDESGNEVTASFKLRAYSLPPRSELSPEELNQARITTANQGFYVFREGRLLARGVWLGIRSVEPHLNLARIEFSFDHRLDDAFQIDIKKSRIHVQADLQEALNNLVGPSIAEAQRRYRKNQRSVAVATQDDLHNTSNKIIAGHEERLIGASVTAVGPGQASIQNSRGTTRVSIRIIEGEDAGGPNVVVQEGLDDGLLFEPTIVNGHQAVAINAGHPFYQRVYEANRGNGTAIQGINFLLWGLCAAEWATVTEDEKDHMRAVRREVSRTTRVLANELPDLDESSDPTDDGS